MACHDDARISGSTYGQTDDQETEPHVKWNEVGMKLSRSAGVGGRGEEGSKQEAEIVLVMRY